MGEAVPFAAGRIDVSTLLNPAPPSPTPLLRAHGSSGHRPARAKQPPGVDGQPQTHPNIFVPVRPLAGYGVNARDTARDYITSTTHQRTLDGPEDPYGMQHSMMMLPSLPPPPRGPDDPHSLKHIDSIAAQMHYTEYQDDDDGDEEDDTESVMSDDDRDGPLAAAPVTLAALSPLALPPTRRSAAMPALRPQPRVARRPESAARGAAGRASRRKAAKPALKMPATTRSVTPKTIGSGDSGGRRKPSATPDETEASLVDWQSLDVPESIWDEAQELYKRVKTMRAVQNRQPNRMKHAILGALMFILCRVHGYPRTFAEICTAAKVSKREIGSYHALMMRVLPAEFSSIRRAPPSEFLRRWCSVLDLPPWVAGAATRVHDRADAMAIVHGKCPISVSATSLWLVIWCYNHRHWLRNAGFALPENTPVSSSATPSLNGLQTSVPSIHATQKDVCRAACVVIATLTSVFKLCLPHILALVDGLLDEHM
ncbi:hypothetical protein IWQ56_003752 [Coemansia nantahalensis]|nr:hypothetical protein IWQ56_003752 [Coemansia nantahalensis]